MICKRCVISILLLSIFAVLFFEHYCFAEAATDSDKQKMLLLCLDGATWNLIEPLMKKGQLPNFSKLIVEGASGELLPERAYSPPSWTSIATGKVEEKHGVHNFSDGRKRKARYIWSILSDSNFKVGVVNWLLTPIEGLNGFIYKAPEWFTNEKSKFYPKDIEAEINKIIPLVKIPDYDSVEGYIYWNNLDMNTIRIAMHLIKRYDPSFAAVGFLGTNPFQHRYWSAFEPEYFDITQEEVKEKGRVITDYYKKIDNFLGDFIKNGYTIIFVSDHGFCRNDARSGPRIIKYYQLNSDTQHVNFYINLMLEKTGLLIFVPKLQKGAQIDFSKSQAYFYNNIKSGLYGIKINREVINEEKVEEVKKRIYTLFKSASFENNENLFIDVKESIPVKNKDNPDIMFKLNPIFRKENMSFQEDKNILYTIVKLNYLMNDKKEKLAKIILDGKEYDLREFIGLSRDGIHEAEGVVIMSGKNIRKSSIIKGARTIDITPTILYLLGVPIAKDMDGKVLYDAIEPDFANGHLVQYIDTYEAKDKEDNVNENLIEGTVIKERLHSLGYAQ